ncbi:MAG: hypothetical protein KF809_15095, partial [Chloroflexi bacterium]|nr:hypothetical protein [Chloroflexota bacterium]
LLAAGRVRLGALQRRTLVARERPRIGDILPAGPGSTAWGYLVEWVSEPRVRSGRTYWTVRYRAVALDDEDR